METVKLPIDYVAIPRVSYDMLIEANYEYNLMYKQLRNVTEDAYRTYLKKGFGDIVDCKTLAGILDISLRDIREEFENE